MFNPRQTTRFANRLTPMCSPDDTKLLISVRDTTEAAIVLAAGVAWIDLKEPLAGSLGQPSLEAATTVAALLAEHPRRSAALGELRDLDVPMAYEFAKLFPVLKVGLSGMAANPMDQAHSWGQRFEWLAAQLSQRGAQLIPVAYADYSICDAPTVFEVLKVTQRVGAKYMLIDTFVKDGRGLLDWISLNELLQIVEIARSFPCGLVFAGSLKIADVPRLLALSPAALAVRGAVCHHADSHLDLLPSPNSTSRTTPIDPEKVAEWCRVVSLAPDMA